MLAFRGIYSFYNETKNARVVTTSAITKKEIFGLHKAYHSSKKQNISKIDSELHFCIK